MSNRISLLVFLLFGFFACQDEPADPSTDCEKLITGLENLDEIDVASEINFLCEDFVPAPSSNDSIGHEANLQAFTRRINSECGNIEAQVLGYATIKTNPPKSEVQLTIFTVDNTFERVLDLNTPEDNVLTFGGLHQ